MRPSFLKTTNIVAHYNDLFEHQVFTRDWALPDVLATWFNQNIFISDWSYYKDGELLIDRGIILSFKREEDMLLFLLNFGDRVAKQ